VIAVNVEITAAAAARAAIRFMATSILPPRVTRQPSIILPAPQILRRFCLRTPGSYGTRLHSRPTAQPASAGPATPYLAAGCASDRRQPAPARGVGHRDAVQRCSPTTRRNWPLHRGPASGAQRCRESPRAKFGIALRWWRRELAVTAATTDLARKDHAWTLRCLPPGGVSRAGSRCFVALPPPSG